MLLSSSAAPRRVERNVRLDPMGIYGTRSARRRRQSQRRRQWQNAILWLVGAAALGFGFWWLWQPHPTSLRAGWTYDLPFRPATPLVTSGDGNLLFASQSGGLWRFSPSKMGQKPRRIFAAAFAAGAAPLATTQTTFWPGADGILSALDSQGKLKWRRAFSSSLVTRPALSRTPQGTIVVAGDDNGQIIAFDAVSGAPKWKMALGGAIGEGIAVSDDPNPTFVVPMLAGAASRGGLRCLDAQTGALKWRFPADARSQSAGIAAPAVSQGRVYWCNDEGAIVALDARSGRKIWKSFAAPVVSQSQPAQSEFFVTLRGAPAVVQEAEVVVVGGNDGFLRAFDLKSGAARWKRNLGGPVHFAAQIVPFEGQNALLASGETPEIFLIEPATGRILRRWTTAFSATLGVAATRNQAFALDTEGHLQGALMR